MYPFDDEDYSTHLDWAIDAWELDVRDIQRVLQEVKARLERLEEKAGLKKGVEEK